MFTRIINSETGSRDEIADKLLAFWKNSFAPGEPGNIACTQQLRENHTQRFYALSPGCTNSLKQYCRETGYGLLMVLVAAFNILVFRYTGRREIQTAIRALSQAKRGKNAVRHRPARIVNCLFDPTFELPQLITQLTAFAAKFHYEQLPFEILTTAIGSDNMPTNMPMIRVNFGYRNLSGDAPISGIWEYPPAAFSTGTIDGMTRHFEQLLLSITVGATVISRMNMLEASERLQLLQQWNNTKTPYSSDLCLHELFEEQAARHPGNTAIRYYENTGSDKISSITYKELNLKANQLADYLRHAGVVTEMAVGILLERSPRMIIALLAVLKAGGAYIPLDPALPTNRLDYMIGDAGIKILLTTSKPAAKLNAGGLKIVCLENDWETRCPGNTQNYRGDVRPENLAYIIYTSGSTGTPKGAMIRHSGVVNYLCWCRDAYGLVAGNGAPVNSSLGFDATITSMYAPLVSGKSILLLPQENEIEALAGSLVAGEGFSLIKITPAHVEILGHLLERRHLKDCMPTIVIGGESLTKAKLTLLREIAPGARFINEYGPTETVVGCCIYDIPANQPLPELIPIGQPIANSTIFILDQHLEPVPLGVVGEIYIGGAGLARGYLNRTELTGKCFISNPFDTSPAMLYKTGDLAKRMPDGNIIYLGRTDSQLKIRGYRIEPGEIEAAILKFPGIRQAVVLTDSSETDRKLVACIVTGHLEMNENNLKLFLKGFLPAYMIPARFLFLEKIPVTSNGKTDRAGILGLLEKQSATVGTQQASGDAVEKKLIEICLECLRIPAIGRRDNFFQLGGNSIQAALIFSKIRKVFGKQIPVATLFRAPTIEKIAAAIKGKQDHLPWSPLVLIQPGGAGRPLFCLHAGAGTILFYNDIAARLATERPVYGLQAKGLSGKESPHTRIEDMAAHYIREIKKVQPQGPYHFLGYCLGAIIAFEMASRLTREGEKVAFLGSVNGVSPVYEEPGTAASPIATSKTNAAHGTHHNNFSTPEKFNPLRRGLTSLKQVKARLNMGTGLRSIANRFFIGLNLPLPNYLRKWYFLETNGKMAKNYHPLPYPGKLVIFRSPLLFADPALGWSGLAAGGIETRDIVGDFHNRREILLEPFAGELVAILQTYLEDAGWHDDVLS